MNSGRGSSDREGMGRRPRKSQRHRPVQVALILVGMLYPAVSLAFSSGSTGSDGAFVPSCAPTPCTVTVALPPSGIFNFTTVTIASGITVTFSPNAANTPAIVLASGDVTVAGGATIDVSGSPGIAASLTGPMVNAGGRGGPGAFRGGQGGIRQLSSVANPPSAGQGPGGGRFPDAASGFCGVGGTYGAPAAFTTLIPLFGGSGGSGQFATGGRSGSSGGGGGGAMVLASSTRIVMNGAILANGGKGGTFANQTLNTAGSGGGGAIRLVSSEISGTGILSAGSNGTGCDQGGLGRIRLEASTLIFTGASAPTASTSTTSGPVTATSTPALIDVPTLTITAVGSAAVQTSTPGALYTTADVVLPSDTTNPVTVTVTATNIPVGTSFSVTVIPQFAASSTVNSTLSAGTFAQSTATASVTIPTGQVTVLNASGSFTIPQLAGVFPFGDGDEIDHVVVAAGTDEVSSLSVVTKSGNTVPVSQLSPEQQLRVARAFDAMRHEIR